MDILDTIQNLQIAYFLRSTRWAYPLINLSHVLSITVLFGTVLAFDLRLLGRARALPLRPLARHLLPLTLGAFCIAVATGSLMFTVDPRDVWGNPFFPWKLGFIALAGLNAAYFHLRTFPSAEGWP
ncbi:MAG: hypothetical protein HOK81_16625, partial [Rhodospirillaceae bacterium]|nr:hypothetical protein [Rhodospirillaceae bacterium]